MKPLIENGLEGLRRLAKFSPYIAGDTFGFADIAAFFQIGFTNLHTRTIYDWDITADVAGLADYLALLRERATVASVERDMLDAMRQAGVAQAA